MHSAFLILFKTDANLFYALVLRTDLYHITVLIFINYFIIITLFIK